MRNVLFITPEFPPVAGTESIRSLRCVKYLPRFGWNPIVLSAKCPRAMSDDSLVSELPEDILIFRVQLLGNKYIYYSLALLGKLLGCPSLPDYRVGWLLLAMMMGEKILRRHRVDVIISRSHPIASHLVGLKLKSNYHIPWIIDFSDPWTQHPYMKYKNRLAYKLDVSFENKVARIADRIIFTTKQARLEFLAKYASISPDKVIVIPNAYDPEGFIPGKKVSKPREFTITHVGNFYGLRSAEPFFKALSLLRATNEIQVKVIMVGAVGLFTSTKSLISKYGLEDVVQRVKHLPHKEIPDYLFNADLLLLIDAAIEPSPFLPMKLTEYICTGKPILAITPEGASADVVRATKTGVVISPKDIEGIKNAIKEYYLQYQNSNLNIEPDWAEIAKYSAEKCTEQLARIMDGLVNSEKRTE